MKIDDEFEPCGPLDRQVSRLRSSQDSVDEGREVAHGVTTIRSVRYETASFCIFSPTCDHRQSCFDRKLSDLLSVPEGHWTGDRANRVRPFASDRTEDLGKIVAVRHRLNVKRDIDAPGRSLIGFPLLFLTGVDTVRQNRDLGSFRSNLPQELQSLAGKFGREERYAG